MRERVPVLDDACPSGSTLLRNIMERRPRPGKQNERFRDLVDLLLLEALFAPRGSQLPDRPHNLRVNLFRISSQFHGAWTRQRRDAECAGFSGRGARDYEGDQYEHLAS